MARDKENLKDAATSRSCRVASWVVWVVNARSLQSLTLKMSQINHLRDHCSGKRAAPVGSVVILIDVGGGQKETCFTFLSTAWSVASGPLGSSGSELGLTSIVDFRDEGHSLVGGLRRMVPLKHGSQKAFAGHMVQG